MNFKSNNLTKEKRDSYLFFYIFVIVLISAFLIALRIIFYFFQEESAITFIDLLIRNRDLNFKTNYDLMNNGIIHYYEDETAIYLYFWYFIFYPFYLIPFEISIYIWDLLRLITTIYIAVNIHKIVENKKDLLFFFLFSGMGYFADMYLNNTNWLIQIFLYKSYINLEKDKKLYSGIFFSLATFKIPLTLFPFIFIITKKIKVKDLVYFFIPLVLICIPYLIFPEYLLSMISNWLYITNTTSGPFILTIFLIIWRLIQPAHLIFISIILMILIVNIKNEEARNKIGSLIYFIVFVFWGLIWIMLLGLALLF
ncbi:MAG: glycosyltransferase 87 family protein [Promethearchaeota archaeon]